jgi:hypothetical protein
MRALAGLGAVILLASGGALGALSDRIRETPRTPPGVASLLGGFSALAVQVLSIRADAATARGDPAEALLQLDMILELEPQLIRGADWIAHEIGVNMAGEEPDPVASFGLVLEGLRVQDRCVEANPGDVDAILQRGNYVLRRFAARAHRAAAFFEATGRSPYEAALDDFRLALEMVPGDVEVLDGIGVAALYAGRDALHADDLPQVRTLLAEARSAFETSLAHYRSEGLESVPTKEWALDLTITLETVLAAPAAEQPALYREFYDRFGGPNGLPGLPEPEAR